MVFQSENKMKTAHYIIIKPISKNCFKKIFILSIVAFKINFKNVNIFKIPYKYKKLNNNKTSATFFILSHIITCAICMRFIL